MLVTSSKISSEETWLGLYCELGVWATKPSICGPVHIQACDRSPQVHVVNESAESQRRFSQNDMSLVVLRARCVREEGKPWGLFPVSSHLSLKNKASQSFSLSL